LVHQHRAAERETVAAGRQRRTEHRLEHHGARRQSGRDREQGQGTAGATVAAGSALLQYITLPGAWNVYTTAWQDLRPDASYTAYGTGYAGSAGVPTLAAGSLPRVGTVFTSIIGNIPTAVAFFGMGRAVIGS
jgi:hypothetical protein